MLVGVALLALVWNVHNKFIAAPLGITGVVLIIVGLQLMANVAEANTTSNNADYKKPLSINSFTEKALHYLGYAVGFSSCGAFIIGGGYFENTIGGTSFFLQSALAGIVLATIYYYTLKKIYPGFIIKNEERERSLFFTCLGITAWAATAIAHYNISTVRSLNTITAVVEDKSKSSSGRATYVFLKLNGKRERFSPVYKQWEKLNQGAPVILKTGTGALNYTYVFDFLPSK
jgi:glucose uptake protein GlcU